MRVYSPFFETLYDEAGPVGTSPLGRGTHYSVLRCLNHWNALGGDEVPAVVQDIIVIWDEDHDVRVIAAIEDLYRYRLLPPVLFVGEAKGTLSVVVGKFFPSGQLSSYEKRLEHVAQSQPDPWDHQLSVWREDGRMIIGNEGIKERPQLYLDAINMLWRPGQRRVDRTEEGLVVPPMQVG